MTAIEVGVAGGNGLVLLCDYRDQIETAVAIKIHLIGLDAGGGLPPLTEPRDLLYCWPAGSFKMDIPKLEARLAGRAKVIIGNVSETACKLDIPADAPLGAVFFDLDYYSSTMNAFALFDKPALLPRVWCYFDDVSGSPSNAYTDYIGVRGAIREFDRTHDPLESHLTRAYTFGFDTFEVWHERMYIYHRMSHPDYNKCVAGGLHVLALTS